MRDLIGWEWEEDLLPHVIDSIRNGDFEMETGYTNAMYDFAEPEMQEPADDNWETFDDEEIEEWDIENLTECGNDENDEYTKEDHSCGLCEIAFVASADDISWMYEASPFMPCGHRWDFLDRVVE